MLPLREGAGVHHGGLRNLQFIADITNPYAPQLVRFVTIPAGSHNQTIHPSGNYMYNSNNELTRPNAAAIEIFDIAGELEKNPVRVGYWNIPEFRPAGGGQDATGTSLRCTSHVLRFYREQKLMTIGWYNAGVRVVDISGLAGVGVGVEPNVTGNQLKPYCTLIGSWTPLQMHPNPGPRAGVRCFRSSSRGEWSEITSPASPVRVRLVRSTSIELIYPNPGPRRPFADQETPACAARRLSQLLPSPS